MEIGSPMASMYLLGNPDHYASHTFANFPWRVYVNFVRKFWSDASDVPSEFREDIPEDSIALQNNIGQIVGASVVDNYCFRPLIYENLNLYEWIQCHQKKQLNNSERLALLEERANREEYMKDFTPSDIRSETDDESLSSFLEEDIDLPDSDTESIESNETTWSVSDPDEIIVEKHLRHEKLVTIIKHLCIGKHTQRDTHGVYCDFTRLQNVIPNFIGGAIPRSDKGDREFYCTTILTIFKPWRNPEDLKDTTSTWDQTFTEHQFSDRQKELINNFKLRYECNDARDDHYQTLQKKNAEARGKKPRGNEYTWRKYDKF
ncbi:hypothetical protein B0H16DRAFT_1481616 [Mycena metata]|uniref:Uncharacterized protein n=1 Tax=Mycena metata TaxID=1033252 RepID=A0AAD7GX74_9AGAR|nr:hypothetical protein B0H16DRAFT_1481616 [Mycena metata]